jgi:hypothetical protein
MTEKSELVVKKEFHAHCKENDKRFNSIDGKLDNLMWLAEDDIKITITNIIKAEQAKSWLSIRVANGLKITGVVIAALAAIFGVFYSIYKEMKR